MRKRRHRPIREPIPSGPHRRNEPGRPAQSCSEFFPIEKNCPRMICDALRVHALGIYKKLPKGEVLCFALGEFLRLLLRGVGRETTLFYLPRIRLERRFYTGNNFLREVAGWPARFQILLTPLSHLSH